MGLVRLFLALSVVVTHNAYSQPFLGGTFAVMIFFVISGFCIALVLNEKYTEASPIKFYVARYLRLWPTYFVVLILATAFLLPSPDFGSASWAYVSQLTLFGHEILWWFGAPPREAEFVETILGTGLARLSGLQQMWSVAIEIAFYVISPLFARRPLLIVGLFVVAFAVHVLLTLSLPTTHPLIMRSAANYFWLYLMGMLAYWGWCRAAPLLDRFIVPAVAVALGGVIAAGALTALRQAPFLIETLPLFRNDISLIVFAAFVIVPVFHYTRSSTWDRAIGELSYPIYVVHFPIVTILLTSQRGTLAGSLVVVGVSVAAALALHLVIERPVDAWRARLWRSQKDRDSGSVGSLKTCPSIAVTEPKH